MTSRPQFLTDSQRNLIIQALQEKSAADAKRAQEFKTGDISRSASAPRLAFTFDHQSSEASLLVTMIEDASDIWLTQ